MTNAKIKCDKQLKDCLQCKEAPCQVMEEVIEKFFSGEKPAVFKTGTEDPRNRLNHLSGEEWLYFTKTLLTTSYPSVYGHDLRKKHGANKPPQLMRELIEFFTKSDGRVLDPFAGVGGTLLGASICIPPRESVGIEINSQWVDIYKEILNRYPELQPGKMILGDCREVMRKMEDCSFDFIAADPPYNLQLKTTMCNGKYEEHGNRRTDYNMRSEDERDLSNSGSYEEFLSAMGDVFSQSFRLLKPGKYMAVILRNAYQDGRYILTQADFARVAQEINGGKGFVLKGEKVWYQAGTRLRPYGYPFSYVPNIVHQYILIFQKPKEKGR